MLKTNEKASFSKEVKELNWNFRNKKFDNF